MGRRTLLAPASPDEPLLMGKVLRQAGLVARHADGPTTHRAVMKRCPFCGHWVQGRGESDHSARRALRHEMVWHVEEAH